MLQSTREYQSALFNEWEQQEGGILIENTQLKEELKNSKETIEQMEAQHAQDKAKFESTRAQDRAEFEQSNAKMEERIEKIMNDLLQLQQQPSHWIILCLPTILGSLILVEGDADEEKGYVHHME